VALSWPSGSVLASRQKEGVRTRRELQKRLGTDQQTLQAHVLTLRPRGGLVALARTLRIGRRRLFRILKPSPCGLVIMGSEQKCDVFLA